LLDVDEEQEDASSDEEAAQVVLKRRSTKNKEGSQRDRSKSSSRERGSATTRGGRGRAIPQPERLTRGKKSLSATSNSQNDVRSAPKQSSDSREVLLASQLKEIESLKAQLRSICPQGILPGQQIVAVPPPRMVAQPPRHSAVLPTMSAQRESRLEAAVALKNRTKEARDEHLAVIRREVKKNMWRKCKFVTSIQTQNAFASAVLVYLNFSDFEGNSPEILAKKAQWVELHGADCTKILNDHRNYVAGRIKEACVGWMKTHEGSLPTKSDLTKCLTRDIDLNNAEEKELYAWWWSDVLGVAVGNMTNWGTEQRLYSTISTSAPRDKPLILNVPPSTEAIAALIIENNLQRWPSLYKVKCDYPLLPQVIKNKRDHHINKVWVELDKVYCQGPSFQCPYTDNTVGQCKFAGWTREGIDRFKALTKMNKLAWETDKCKEVEANYLQMLRDSKGITKPTLAEQNAAKRRKTQIIGGEDDEAAGANDLIELFDV